MTSVTLGELVKLFPPEHKPECTAPEMWWRDVMRPPATYFNDKGLWCPDCGIVALATELFDKHSSQEKGPTDA